MPINRGGYPSHTSHDVGARMKSLSSITSSLSARGRGRLTLGTKRSRRGHEGCSISRNGPTTTLDAPIPRAPRSSNRAAHVHDNISQIMPENEVSATSAVNTLEVPTTVTCDPVTPITANMDTPLRPDLQQIMQETLNEVIDDEDVPFNMGEEESNPNGSDPPMNRKRKPRGPLIGKDLAPPKGYYWKIIWTPRGQAVGDNQWKLARRLGQYARRSKYFPIDIKDWRKVLPGSIEDVCDMLKKEFDFDPKNNPDYVSFIYGSLNIKWKEWKKTLKKKHYLPYNTPEERIEKLDHRVDRNQWLKLVEYWESPKGKAISTQNKLNNAQRKLRCTSGTVPVAQVGWKMEQVTGSHPSRTEVFGKAFCSKTKKKDFPYNKEVLSKLETTKAKHQAARESQPENEVVEVVSIDDLSFVEVLGPEVKNRMRGMGYGARCNDVFTPVGRHRRQAITSMQIRMDDMERARKDEELRRRELELELREKNIRIQELELENRRFCEQRDQGQMIGQGPSSSNTINPI